jgi:hypothetical protein
MLDKVDKKIIKGLINDEEKDADKLYDEVKQMKLLGELTKSDIKKVDRSNLSSIRKAKKRSK